MDQLAIAKSNMVIVKELSFSGDSTCHSRRCKKKDKYTIFLGEYPRLSTMLYGACKDHLPKFIDMAIKASRLTIRNETARAKREERRKAKELLGIKP